MEFRIYLHEELIEYESPLDLNSEWMNGFDLILNVVVCSSVIQRCVTSPVLKSIAQEEAGVRCVPVSQERKK